MKTKTIKKVTVIAMATALLALNSCQKEKTNLQTQTSGNDVSLGTIALNASQLAINSLQNSTNSYKQEESLLASCAVETLDTVSKPHSYTVDYGSGCTGSDGITRSGKIIVKFNSLDFRLVNNSFTTSFQNYVEGSDALGGGETIKNLGFNSKGNLHYSIVFNVQDTYQGTVYQQYGNYGYEWIAGESTTQIKSDDAFSLTGYLNGKNHVGQSYTGTITSPLIQSAACNNLYVQGTVLYKQVGSTNKIFDFGNGTCTGNVTLTQGGVSSVKPQTQSFY